jgi:pimeloyl-ACP methyl ester carboxylesterase
MLRAEESRMRWWGALLIALVGLGWVGWRSGDRAPVDEVAIAEARSGLDLESRRIDTGEVALHVVLAGPETGPPVVLLHGFPELWFSWHAEIGPLAHAGYRVIVPDLRGTNRSDKPAGVEAYGGGAFARDVLGLLDALGLERAFVAGHDVGAGVAWTLVLFHPERVRRAVILSGPHPLAWESARPQDDPESISWFRSFFQLPFLPEWVARAGGWWLLTRSLVRTSRPGTFEGETLAVFQSAWARDNAISTMLNVYRAPFRSEPIPGDGRPRVPVRYVYGGRDAYIPREASLLTAEMIGAEAAVELPEASHWLLLEEPERVAALLVEFFGRATGDE